METIENDLLKAEVSSHGAELQSIVDKRTGRSYLWYGDPAYWGRRSPVLFPFVGQVNHGIYRVNGVEYPMSQHGFARDRDFTLADRTADSVTYVLKSDEKTLAMYPFPFTLAVSVRLSGRSVLIRWQVTNDGQEDLPFSIGGHPAFLCPPSDEKESPYSCSIVFYDENGKKPEILTSRTVEAGTGTVNDRLRTYALQDGRLPITEHLFDEDALIFENRQACEAALADSQGHEFIRVRFPEPLFGVWSPAGKDAPFVCIEPWYGRCDSIHFNGELKDREWGQTCRPGETFDTEYEIITG